ncbi:uncharacterized protein METZ01_LOCUS64766 [marine metagenome]|uniref:Uncharacterized protein n=1 Tax=marine metagenome TaxID=408172 RepID=A0A381T6U6_9ZZZZ
MAAIVVNTTDTFEQWRVKTNQLGLDVFDAVRNVHEDLTPALGGDLYLNNTEAGYTGSFDILGTGNINITGNITCTGDIAGADITGTDLTMTGGISGANFSVSSANGNVTGSNWSVDGATGDMTITGNYAGATFSGDLIGTINTATTAITQAAAVNNTTVATTEYVTTGIQNAHGVNLTIDTLADTVISNPQEQDLLMYDSANAKWASGSIVAAGVPNQAFTVAMAVALGY